MKSSACYEKLENRSAVTRTLNISISDEEWIFSVIDLMCKQEKEFLVLSHCPADADSILAMLYVKLAIMKLGGTCKIYCDNPLGFAKNVVPLDGDVRAFFEKIASVGRDNAFLVGVDFNDPTASNVNKRAQDFPRFRFDLIVDHHGIWDRADDVSPYVEINCPEAGSTFVILHQIAKKIGIEMTPTIATLGIKAILNDASDNVDMDGKRLIAPNEPSVFTSNAWTDCLSFIDWDLMEELEKPNPVEEKMWEMAEDPNNQYNGARVRGFYFGTYPEENRIATSVSRVIDGLRKIYPKDFLVAATTIEDPDSTVLGGGTFVRFAVRDLPEGGIFDDLNKQVRVVCSNGGANQVSGVGRTKVPVKFMGMMGNDTLEGLQNIGHLYSMSLFRETVEHFSTCIQKAVA